MGTLAIFKWAIDPQDGVVKGDGTVQWSGAKPAVGDDDHAVVAIAKAAAGDEPFAGLTFADRDVSFAAARGAESTVVIDGADSLADLTARVEMLAAAVKKVEGADVVAIADGEWEPAAAAALAGELGWPVVLMVDDVRPEGDALVVTRRFGMGTQELRVHKPVVLGAAARREEQDKPGMKAILAARKKPTETIDASDLGISQRSSKLSTVGTKPPAQANSKIFDGDDPAAAAEWVVSALKADGIL